MKIAFRHCDEATKDFARSRIAQLFPDIEVIEITNEPFYKTFIAMLEQCQGDDCLAVDADLILTNKNEVLKLTQYPLSGAVVFDRFRGVAQGGCHFHSKAAIDVELEILPKLQNRQSFIIRPESTTIYEAAKVLGVRVYEFGNVVGFHDFYQYTSDIFAKFVYRTWRSINIIDNLNLSPTNSEELAAIHGIEFGRKTQPQHFSRMELRNIYELQFRRK